MYIAPAIMTALVTRVFVNGNSQAVRIPAEYRLDTDRVEISRAANGDLVLHPVREGRGARLMRALEGFNEGFVAALEAEHTDQPPMQDRDGP